MITKETTKRAAKILAEQKREYERKFQRAKGDSKAIASAAAEYRSEYGKTPLKRWHNALSQAAKETASHSAPVRKPAKPASKPVAAPKAAPKKRTSKEDKEAIDLLYRYVVYPLSLNSEMYYTYYYEYKLYDSVKSLVKNQEIKKGLFALIDGCNSFSDLKKEKLKEIIEKTLKGDKPIVIASYKTIPDNKPSGTQKPAKAPLKPKATYRVGTYLQSPQGDVYRIVAANVMPLKNPYIRYDLREYMGNTHYTLDDKPDKIAAWKYLSPKDGFKMWKQKIASERRAREAKEAAERKEEEKRRIAEQKAIVRRNPEWIKSFAKQTGLTPATIDALYKLCTKDDLRQVMWGVYVSEDGDLVATDAHLLAAVSVNAPKSLRGKIFAPSGKTVEGRYPNYKGVLVSRGKVKVYVGHAQVSRSYDYSDNKPGAEFQDYRGNTCIEIGNQRFVADTYKRLMKVFDTLHEKPLCLQTGEETTAAGFVSNHIKSVIMPVLKE